MATLGIGDLRARPPRHPSEARRDSWLVHSHPWPHRDPCRAAKFDDKKIRAAYETRLMMLGIKWHSLPFGCIIGSVYLDACRPASEVAREREDWQLVWGDYRPHGDDGKTRFAFVLSDPIKLEKSIPWKGRQGFEVPDNLFPGTKKDASVGVFLTRGFTKNQ
jgi:hypothetical protein